MDSEHPKRGKGSQKGSTAPETPVESAPAAPTIDPAHLERAILLLTNGLSVDRVAMNLVATLGADAPAAEAAVNEARRRLTLAADFNRDEEIGKSRRTLESLLSICMAKKDVKTALQVQAKLIDLMGLKPAKDEAPSDEGDESAGRLRVIEGYLLPLKLVETTYPIEEHARVAAEIIRREGVRLRKGEGAGR